jgi:hypothetical protein
VKILANIHTIVKLGVGVRAKLAGCAAGAERSNGALGDNRTTSMLISPHTRLVISQQSLSLLFQKKKNKKQKKLQYK